MSVAGTLPTGRHTGIYPAFDLSAKQFAISVAGQNGAGDARCVDWRTWPHPRASAAPHGTLASPITYARPARSRHSTLRSARTRESSSRTVSRPVRTTADGSQQLSGYLTAPIFNAPVVGPVPASTR